jgi:hypothetical protein
MMTYASINECAPCTVRPLRVLRTVRLRAKADGEPTFLLHDRPIVENHNVHTQQLEGRGILTVEELHWHQRLPGLEPIELGLLFSGGDSERDSGGAMTRAEEVRGGVDVGDPFERRLVAVGQLRAGT